MPVRFTQGPNFINILHTRFSFRKFVQSQNVTRKKTFVRKMRVFNVDEIDTWAQFHQCPTYSFYAHRSGKHKKDSQVVNLFYAFGIYERKGSTLNVDEIDY